MGFLSPMHWIVILVVAVLLFGHRLPEVARSMGRSVREFKRGLRDVEDSFDKEWDSDSPEKLPPPDRERRDEKRESEKEEAGESRKD